MKQFTEDLLTVTLGSVIVALYYWDWLLHESSVFRPFRAMFLAYTYVLTGSKVNTPYEWSEI